MAYAAPPICWHNQADKPSRGENILFFLLSDCNLLLIAGLIKQFGFILRLPLGQQLSLTWLFIALCLVWAAKFLFCCHKSFGSACINVSTTRKVTHTHFKDLQSAAATAAAAEVAKNKKGAPGICGKALGHDNYNPSQVQGINKEEGEGQTLGRQWHSCWFICRLGPHTRGVWFMPATVAFMKTNKYAEAVIKAHKAH